METGGCPHAAIREDIGANLSEVESLTGKFNPEFCLLESGGDNLAANFSRELADFIIYVIDVCGGDKIPRKGGPGVTQADLLIINKKELADAVGASVDVMTRDANAQREGGAGDCRQRENRRRRERDCGAHFESPRRGDVLRSRASSSLMRVVVLSIHLPSISHRA